MLQPRMLFCVAAVVLLTAAPAIMFPASISYDEKSFLLDGKRVFLFSGELHYWRIPQEEWAERISRLKAAGFNAISMCAPWAWHERTPGEIDLSDLEEFLGLCQRHGLFVLAKIGPVTGAELELNGIPYWLVAKKVPDIDRDGELYLRYAARWYNAVCPLVARHQVTRGGAVILVQVDNEYENTLGQPSSAEPGHLRTLSRAARERGIEVPLYINYRLWPPADIPDVLTALDIYPGSDVAQASRLQIPEGHDSVRAALARQRQRWPARPLCVAEFAPFKNYLSPSPSAPSAISAVSLAQAYKINTLAMLSSGACLVNYYTASGGWNFPYWGRHDVGNVHYERAPISASGGLNDSFWTARLIGQWLASFGSDFLSAESSPDGRIEVLSATQGSDSEESVNVRVRGMATSNSLYIFLEETDNKPAAVRLRVEGLFQGAPVTFPAENHIPMPPRGSKILVAGISVDDTRVLYSTSEFLSCAELGDARCLILYGERNTPGETAILTGESPVVSKSVRISSGGGVVRFNYVHSSEEQLVQFDKLLLVITSTERAARTYFVGEGKQKALLVTDADLITDVQSGASGLQCTFLCTPGEARVSAFFATAPRSLLLDGKKVSAKVDGKVQQFTVKTPSLSSYRLSFRRGKLAAESSLQDNAAQFVTLSEASALTESGFWNPGFVRLRTAVPKGGIDSLVVRGNFTPPPVLHVNQKPVSCKTAGQNKWAFDLASDVRQAENRLHLTLEFQSAPELEISTAPDRKLQWEVSPGLKGEWLHLFARPDGPEWQDVRLPKSPAPDDITWYALPFTLHPQAGWEQPLLLNLTAGREALCWVNGRRFIRYSSNLPQETFPIPRSWLLEGQNLLVVAARGAGQVAAELTSDDAHSLMHRRLEIGW